MQMKFFNWNSSCNIWTFDSGPTVFCRGLSESSTVWTCKDKNLWGQARLKTWTISKAVMVCFSQFVQTDLKLPFQDIKYKLHQLPLSCFTLPALSAKLAAKGGHLKISTCDRAYPKRERDWALTLLSRSCSPWNVKYHCQHLLPLHLAGEWNGCI